MFKKIGRDCVIDPRAIIFGEENIELGDNVRIDAGVKILASKGFLKIGSHVHIACGSTLLCGGGIKIDDHCGISFDCKLISVSENFNGRRLLNPNIPLKYRDPYASTIYMEKFSMIATGSLVLPGCVLKEGSVLGAMSLLRANTYIPEWTTALGNPVERFFDRHRKVPELASEFEKEYNELPKDEPQG